MSSDSKRSLGAALGMILFWLALTTFLVNLPFGYWRSRRKRFSLSWIFFVHAPIPGIILTRLFLGIGYGAVPFLVASAFAGQVAGGKMDPSPKSSPQGGEG